MASGYIHISRKDLIFDDDNGVVYWKNGGRYLGEIAKAVLNAGEENETVKYYLKSAVTKKAILIDAGVTVGGGDYYFVTDEANFINARIESADFSSDGGGDGVTVTFLLPESKYYTVRYVESNGDIKIYDPNGTAGTLVPDALPDTTDAAAGDTLVLDADKKPTWDAIPDELPAIVSGDAGKVLKVNSGETGVEWGIADEHIYLHMFSSVDNNRTAFAWYFDSNSLTDWRTFLTTNGFTDRNKLWGCCSGYIKSGDIEYPCCGVFVLSSTELGLRYDVGSSLYSFHGNDNFFNGNTITYQLI